MRIDTIPAPRTLPAGYRYGALDTSRNENVWYVIRESDGAFVLVPAQDATRVRDYSAAEWDAAFAAECRHEIVKPLTRRQRAAQARRAARGMAVLCI